MKTYTPPAWLKALARTSGTGDYSTLAVLVRQSARDALAGAETSTEGRDWAKMVTLAEIECKKLGV